MLQKRLFNSLNILLKKTVNGKNLFLLYIVNNDSTLKCSPLLENLKFSLPELLKNALLVTFTSPTVISDTI